MNYSDQDFTKLKYTDVYFLLIQRVQFYLDSHTDLLNTWLHPISFRYWIRNSDGSVPKYNELLISHRSGLRSLRDTYIHILHELLLTVECSTHSHVLWECTPTFHLHAIIVSPYFLIKRTTNSYGTQRLIVNITIVLLITYHLVANIFKD